MVLSALARGKAGMLRVSQAGGCERLMVEQVSAGVFELLWSFN